MASTVGDFKLSSTAAGFTLGFGVLTVWEAIKQTRNVRSPLRSVYIYMVWGEIVANLAIGIIGWLFLDGKLSPTVPVLFGILFLWVFEIQFLMQIIINRIAVLGDNRQLIWKLKWGTALIITLVNIAVMIIWIPAHVVPPPMPIFVEINRYWDRTSKVIILLVDAGLNYYFLRVVRNRLVKYHGLTKYAPLISFNAKLMVLSIGMDLMLILLMSLRNQVVYIQFHPVAYMVKLNIEMTMARLITKLAQNSVNDRVAGFTSSHNQYSRSRHDTEDPHTLKPVALSGIHTSVTSKHNTGLDDGDGIRTTKEVHVQVNHARNGARHHSDDELPLAPGPQQKDLDAQVWER
ncbi:Uncharacterized protein BP5553_09617 [Venustampulla echinocandica]|uniref:Integral membrane protein n=1 Tax=Venustampulla echinocandica TaxID=2656787 RepID=A0A370TBH5_9HELO|nr:Uncharacterized protein BP5553_09617 [Venustampulla echinocandica]RDL31408.1 Uncharacterized protein BP5553_09617 [Venustampulla echinocandica]